jgi:hypothetical protein
MGFGEPYVGSCRLVSGEIAEDFSAYYTYSEQQPTAMALGVRVGVDYTCVGAGGIVLQPMPGCEEKYLDEAENLIGNALTQYEPGLVMFIGDYQFADVHQLVEDFARENPGAVMEIPETTVQLYPNSGRQRILELKFTYQSSRDSLRAMGDTVQRVFNSAALYVSHDADDSRKLSQLYSFLMERFTDYQIKTSITPAYSLLNHGVGDSNAFAVVFAEMCQRAGVESYIVVGTRRGEPWSWNIVLEDGYYYHVDLLACRQWGGYHPLNDGQMGDYVWDYSAYPACPGKPAVQEGTQTTTEATLPSEPEQTTEPSTEPTVVTEPEE